MASTDQGTFGETESEIKYVIEWLPLSESIGDEGTFLNGCFKKETRKKEKKKKKEKRQRAFKV